MHNLQLRVRLVYPVIDPVSLSEIEGGSVHGQKFVRAEMPVVQNAGISLHLKEMFHHITATATFEVEIGMV